MKTKVAPLGAAELHTEEDLAIILDPEHLEENRALENLMVAHPDMRAAVRGNEGKNLVLVTTFFTM